MEAAVKTKNLIGDYKVSTENIGSGSYSIVRKGFSLRTVQPVAVKIIDLLQPQFNREKAFKEVEALREVGKHKNIIALYDVVEEDRFLYLFMEYASGGDLFSFVQKHGNISESKARIFFKQMIEAVQFCHDKKIVHHDIKLENLLLQNPDQSLRLSDFGFCQKINPNEHITSYCGSPLYMAPEIFSLQPHSEQVDIWSLGVCLYVMVSGTFPFVSNSYSGLEEKVIIYDPAYLYGYSGSLNDLIQGMLRKDPLKRLSLSAVKQHKWVNEGSRQ